MDALHLEEGLDVSLINNSIKYKWRWAWYWYYKQMEMGLVLILYSLWLAHFAAKSFSVGFYYLRIKTLCWKVMQMVNYLYDTLQSQVL